MANSDVAVSYLDVKPTGVYYEKKETRTPLSEQLFQKRYDHRKQFDNLGIVATLSVEGGTRLIAFLKPEIEQPDTQTILALLAPLTPAITFSRENSEVFVMRYHFGY